MDSRECFRVKQPADRRVVVERHFADLEFGIHRDLRNKRKKSSVSGIPFPPPCLNSGSTYGIRVREGRVHVIAIAILSLVVTGPCLERVVARLELGNVHPLAVDVVLVNVAAIDGNTLVPVIGTLVSGKRRVC